MKLNRTTFFAYVRKAPFGGRLSTDQVDGMNAILDYWSTSGLTDFRWLAYMLATTFHETGATMQPVRETFASSDAQAISRLDAAFKAGKLGSVKKPYWRKDANGLAWFGRGLPQITHKTNYVKMAQILGIPLDKNPSLALDMSNAIQIMFEGMTRGLSSKGDFTGKSLEDYFNDTTDDPVNARSIINGTDKAKLIAGYYRNFRDAIKKAVETYVDDGRKTDYIAPDVKPEDAKPDNVPVAQSKSLWAILGTFFSGSTALPFLGNVNNAYALGAFTLILVAAGVAAWLVLSGRVTINRSKAIT